MKPARLPQTTAAILALTLLGPPRTESTATKPTGTDASNARQVTSPDRAPQGVTRSDWQSIRAAYEAGRHALKPTETGWQANNPGQHWLITFDKRGFLAQPKDGAWHWGLELLSYGFGDAQQAIVGVPAVKAEGRRLAYEWDANLQEWFINDQRGLEHGFTLARKPAGSGDRSDSSGSSALSFTLTTRGSLRPQITPDAKGVLFQDASGATVVNYAGLKVWDADGEVLHSRFEMATVEPGVQAGVLRLLVDERGARYPLTVDPLAQQAYLKAGQVTAGDNFGLSVAVSGDTVVVGAPFEDGGTPGVNGAVDESATDAGAAYVFVRSGTAWSQQAYLKAGQVTAGDNFGYSVAVSGDTVVVGAHGEDGSATGVNGTVNESAGSAGAAYVFVRSGTAWSQQAYLKAGQVTAGDYFGTSVAVSGDTVVVGALYEDGSATGVNGTVDEAAGETGAAYVFVRSGTTWSQQAYLKAGQASAFDFFGASVAVSGDTVVVGASGEDGSAAGVNGTVTELAGEAGAAHVFVRSGTMWSQQAYLKASQVSAFDNFGNSVAVSGDAVVVGAPYEDGSATGVNGTEDEAATDAGAAYVFVRSGMAWSQQAYLKAGQVTAYDNFGISVAVSGDAVVVGAYSEDGSATGVNGTQDEAASEAGAAYVFARSGTTWNQQAYLKARQVSAFDHFGASVAVSGDTVVVGAHAEDGSATGVNGTEDEAASAGGAAYVFAEAWPEVAATGNSVDIADGDGTPAFADHTDFGRVDPTGASLVRTFTVHNTGTASLTLGSVTVGGADAADFTVNLQPTSPVPPGGSTTFQVTFDPSATGLREATVSVTNNDTDENPFNFSIQGTGYIPTTGDLDPLDPNVVGNAVFAMAVQPDGKTIIGGLFASVQGVPRNNIARLNADGTLDMDFDPNANGAVYSVAAQGDGKVLLGGNFTTLQPNGAGAATTRNRIARVNGDGTLDTGFDPRANSAVHSVAVQGDGKVLLGGFFTTLQPNGAGAATTRNRIARVNGDGTLDASFDPKANNAVYSVALQADGKVLLGGLFTTLQPNGAVSTTLRNRIARVNGDGTLDTDFDPRANNVVYSVAMQADGKVLLGGFFTTLQPNGAGASTMRSYIARVNANGTIDSGFDPKANDAVYSLVVQTDGRVLLGGQFTTLQPNGAGVATTRNRIARVNGDGTLDLAFDPNANTNVTSVAVEADGKVLLGGGFTTLQPNGAGAATTRNLFARLLNDPATQSLTTPSASRVEWLRGGTSPEVEEVTFELSTDGGAIYSALGAGTRIGGGWERTGLSLPESGHIRARGRTAAGYVNGSGGLVETIASFSGIVPLAPEVDVVGNGVSIVDGDTTPALADHTDFGDALVNGGAVVRTFTVHNGGADNLTLGGVTVGGADATDFTVNLQPASPVPPGGNTTFQLTFSPSATGPRSATLSVTNNDPNENPFDFSIQGAGVPGCPSITLASLPNGIVGTSYSGATTASGGIGPYTYSVTSGSVPTGLTFNSPLVGGLSGTPSATGAFNFEITATDTATSCTGAAAYSVVIGSSIAAGDLVIREFRLRGPAGESDEYVVLHNRSTAPLTVAAVDGSSGFAVASSDGSVLFTIPNGTVIKPRGHFLGVNTTGFSLGVAHDASWSTDLADGSGLALFKTANPANFTSGMRLDAAGFGSGISPYFEGTTLTSPGAVSGEYAWVRKAPSGIPQDTNSNGADFLLVATDAGIYGGVQSTLGSPTPAGSDTWDAYAAMSRLLIEPTVGVNVSPNRIRTGSGNSGTLEFRVRAKNVSAVSIPVLRLRVLDLTTLQSPGYSTPTQADLRPVSGPDVVIPATTIGVTNLEGLTLQTPPAQSLGGGLNSTLSIPLAIPLAPGATVDFNLVFNIHRSGGYRFWITYEAGQ